MNKVYFFILLAITICACDTDHSIEEQMFTSISSEESGISFSNDLEFRSHQNIINYLYYYNGGGVAVGDIDGDGLEDLIFTANQKTDRLYKNLGNLEFKDITEKSGLIGLENWSSGVSMDDVNGDGHLDIYICKVALVSKIPTHNLLYINNGDGTFEERSFEYGVDFSGYSTQASWLDYDNDGDLDMYLLNHSVHKSSNYGKAEKHHEKDSFSGDIFYENRLNEAEGKFVDVTEQVKTYSSALGYGLGVASSDIDGDGFMDIYVGNDFHEDDYLYINNGDKTFTESMKKWTTHTSQYTMGVDIADIDGDGKFDVYTTDMMPYSAEILMKSGGDDTEQVRKIKDDLGFGTQYSRNHLQINKGETFSEEAHITNTFATDWSWSVLLQDFDNSGTCDIFISNGIAKRPNDLDYINYINTPENRQKEGENADEFAQKLIGQMPELKLKNILFSNEGNLKFSEVNKSGIGKETYSNGAAYADLDQDGDLDLITNNINDPASILRNDQTGSDYVSFYLVSHKNESAKGSKVTLYQGETKQVKEYITTRGYQSSSTHQVHFGLGNELGGIDSIIVVWPGGDYQKFLNISKNNHYQLSKGKSELLAKKMVTISEKPVASINVLSIKHDENVFDDFSNEALAPQKLSRKGPASLYEDYDGDGNRDLFIGGARNGESHFFLGRKGGSFERRRISAFVRDAKFEDVDAASIDVDNDGDLDIYVVSGGNDVNENNALLTDRLYMNDGKANFQRVPIPLPKTNGSTVSVGDFDNDGYDDIFVGSQNIPGVYGLSPYSYIMKNEGGKALNLIYKERLGMVSDSQWKDINGDGKAELIAVGSWMPISIISHIKDSSFVEISENMNLPKQNGMFRTVEVADVNSDGIPDFILGNLGLNTRWKSDQESKMTMYLDDFDGNNHAEPILFSSYNGKKIPFAAKTELTKQIPTIRKDFNTFQEFTEVNNIQELTNKSISEIVETKEVSELKSMMYVSNSDGLYDEVILPRSIQLSNIEDVAILGKGDKRKFVFVGNNDDMSHNVGKTSNNRGIVLSAYEVEQKTFLKEESLGLPVGTIMKKIHPIDDTSFLIITNDDIQYLVSLEN